MKIAVISSQADKNPLLEACVRKAVSQQNHTVLNFGVFPQEAKRYSYVQIALQISLLLESGAVDFVVTGCSSGQGMALACNSLPGVLCGYVATPSDAYLFGRINDGNAASFPLGLHFGWAGELNLQNTMNSLFDTPFGIGYPPQDAARKQRDTRLLKSMNRTVKRSLLEVLPQLDDTLVRSAPTRKPVMDYILSHGGNPALAALLKKWTASL